MSNESSAESLGYRIGRCTVGTVTSPLYLAANVGVGMINGLTQANNPLSALFGVGTGLVVGAGVGISQTGRHFVGIASAEEKQINGATVEQKMCWEPGVEAFERLAVSR